MSLELLKRVFHHKSRKKNSINPRKVYFGNIYDNEILIDDVLVTYFHAPYSYTGEDMAEVSCHGSVYIQERILRLFIDCGARLAEPGEFTLRAFLNGRIDLAQAEGIADLIASVNSRQHHFALQQIRGGISNKLKTLRNRLVEFGTLLELELDFSQEDVEFADRLAMNVLLDDILQEIQKLTDTFRTGNAIKRGIPVAITGRPNAGKSTLLNALLDEDKALVSELPGTTRDAIEDCVMIKEIPFRLIDTAGLRDEPDTIEALGIERSFEKISQAAIVLYLFDAPVTGIDEIKEELAFLFERLRGTIEAEELNRKQFILVANKIDKMVEIPHHFRDYLDMEVVFISAKRHENLTGLTDALTSFVDTSILQNQLVITSARHFEALSKSLEAIKEAQSALNNNIPSDLVAVDIRKALHHIGVITGAISSDEMLQNIFGKFCIGK